MAQTMTITQALVELKTLDARIHRAINDGTYVAYYTGTAQKIEPRFGTSVEDFTKRAGSKLQSVLDLIERRKRIKSAVVISNAGVKAGDGYELRKITIGGKEMTIAEALERKNSSIAYDEALLAKLESDYALALSKVQTLQKELDRNVEDFVRVSFGTEATKHRSAEQQASVDAYTAQRQPILLDPLGIRDMIDKLRTEIEDFKAEVDYALVVANTQTTIEIDG